MKTVLLAGQSNMAGRGLINQVDKICNEKIKMLRDGKWILMKEPIHNNEATAGIGPAASFAQKFVNRFNQSIGLIPCAVGGTSISKWQPGKKLFNDMIDKGKQINDDDEISVILWAQGETDSRIYDTAINYDNLFFDVLEAVDKKLGTENVPVIIADIPQFYFENPAYPYSRLVSEKIKSIVASSPRFRFVNTDGLETKGDNLHYNSASYRILGERFFEQYLSV